MIFSFVLILLFHQAFSRKMNVCSILSYHVFIRCCWLNIFCIRLPNICHSRIFNELAHMLLEHFKWAMECTTFPLSFESINTSCGSVHQSTHGMSGNEKKRHETRACQTNHLFHLYLVYSELTWTFAITRLEIVLFNRAWEELGTIVAE